MIDFPHLIIFDCYGLEFWFETQELEYNVYMNELLINYLCRGELGVLKEDLGGIRTNEWVRELDI